MTSRCKLSLAKVKFVLNVRMRLCCVAGEPRCGSTQQWHILHYANAPDELWLLPTGVLRHLAYGGGGIGSEDAAAEQPYDLLDAGTAAPPLALHHDYTFGQYCLERHVDGATGALSTLATVCAPEHGAAGVGSHDFLIRKVGYGDW